MHGVHARSRSATILGGIAQDSPDTLMKLKIFLAGSVATVVASVALGIISGMAWSTTLALGLAVWFTAQILYVGFIALAARRAKRAADNGQPPQPTGARLKTFTRNDQA